MKTIIAFLIGALCAHAQVLISDGTKPFPVVVQVFEEDGETPASGAEVSLINLATNLRREEPKAISEALEKPVATDARGCAILFFVGRFGHQTVDGKLVKYSQSLDGTVVVRYKGRELLQVSLRQWATDHGYTPNGNDAPLIKVVAGKNVPIPGQ